MPKDAYWLKHDSNASQDLKIKALRRKYSWQGYGWYWYLVEMLRCERIYKLEYTDVVFESLASDMGCPIEETKKFVDDCIRLKLFCQRDGYFFSERLLKDMAHLDDIRQKTSYAGKISAEKRYGKSVPITPDEKEPETGSKIANMITLYEQKLGRTLTPNDLEQLKDMADNYPKEWFERAVDEAVNKKAKAPMPYIARILETWMVQSQPVKSKSIGNGMEGLVEV